MTDQELERSLTRCTLHTSTELDGRILAAAEGALPAAERRGPFARTKWRRGGLLTIATALVLVLAATFRLMQPRESWAQVQEALRARPWMLASYVDPDGTRHEDWTSFTRGVTATRQGDSARFHDHRLKVVYGYDPHLRTLSRSPELESDGLHDGFDRLLQQIFRGEEKLDVGAGAKLEIVEQKRQPVAKDGRVWQSYELVMREAGDLPEEQNPSVRLTFLVDPQTHLPHFLTARSAARVPPPDAPPPAEFAITWPEQGPLDIYDLGVPRDAKLVDRVPNNDLRRILAGIQASADRFGDYRAMSVISEAAAPWFVGTPTVTWKRGTSYRLVFGLVDADGPREEVGDPAGDPARWWKARWKRLYHRVNRVGDGKHFWNETGRPPGWDGPRAVSHPLTWKRSAWPPATWESLPDQSSWPASQSSWPARNVPLSIVYPETLVNYAKDRWDPVVDASPTDGAPNTIKVVLRSTSGENRYWIDPQRSHMVVRYEMAHRDETRTPPEYPTRFTSIVEAAERAPSGIWYPTVQRMISSTEENGERKTIESINRHYLDFDMKFPEEIFKPVDRPGESLE